MTMTGTLRRRSLVIAAFVLLLALAAAVFFLTRARPAPPQAPQAAAAQPGLRPALAVSVAQPQQVQLAVTLAANGNIAAWQEASVGSESNGLRLAEVRVNVGDTVRKGQVLAVFSPETVNADLAQARAALAEAEAAAADAAGNAERARTLEQTGALSQQQIHQYLTSAKTAQARVEAARAALAVQQVRGRNTRVLAPDDGVISARSATVGSVVSAGTELFRLVRQGRLEWRAEVTSAELSRIVPGTAVALTAASGEQVRGTVRTVAPTVDPQTRNALVYVDLPGAWQKSGTGALSGSGAATGPGAVKAGMFARGEFELGRSAALTVPQAAVVPRDGFNHVMVLRDDSHVLQTRVEVGRRIGDRVEITSKLPAQTRIVVQGAGFLNDGDLVRVVTAPTGDSEKKEPATPATPAQGAIK